MRWTENATIAQKEVGYAEYPGYQASGTSAVAGGLATRRGDATRRAQPAVTPRLRQISGVSLSHYSDRSRCGQPCGRGCRRLMEARGLRKPRVFYVLLGGGRLLVWHPDTGAQPGPVSPAASGGTPVQSDRADLLTIAARRGPTLIRRCVVARQRRCPG
jgi:hypothetical protein